MPYHSFGISKGGNIGQLQQEFPVPGEEEKKNWISCLNKMEKKKGNGWFWNTRDRECAEDSVKFLAHSL